MIGLLITLVGLILLVIGLILAGRTECGTLASVGEFIGICGCLVLIGVVAFYGISFSLGRLR